MPAENNIITKVKWFSQYQTQTGYKTKLLVAVNKTATPLYLHIPKIAQQ
jgi:hypothetical protein